MDGDTAGSLVLEMYLSDSAPVLRDTDSHCDNHTHTDTHCERLCEKRDTVVKRVTYSDTRRDRHVS
jgi:hypothetical protein